MVDWTKPIEDMTGRPLVIDGHDSWDNSRWVRLADTDDPNNKGEWFDDDGTPQNAYGYFEGKIRNRVEPANDELAELRAFKEAAIKRFPELAAKVDPDFAEAKDLMQGSAWNSGTECDTLDDPYFEGSVCDVVLKGIKRGRELERYAQGLTTPKD